MTARIVLHLDMDAFFASVEQQANPWLRGHPVFVCGNRHSRTVVATASYEARAFGVTTGMPLQEARALCPHAILVEGNPEKYAACFRQVLELMERYSPLLEVFSIDEAFLDLTDTAERFGGPLAVAHALQAAVQDHLGLSCSIGLGPNKLIAKLASSRKKPHGLTQIQADEVAAVLADLPVEELCGIGPASQAALNAHGIATCGQLAGVDPAWLIRRFGACAGAHLARLTRGLDDRKVVPSEDAPPPKSMGHLHTLEHDADDPEVLRAVLLDLAEHVGRRLRAAGAAGRTVTLTLRDSAFTTFTRARTLERFLDDGYEIYEEGCRLLAAWQAGRRIRLVGIAVSGLTYGLRQLWWAPGVLRQRRLLEACDRIQDRFGDGSLMRATRLLAEAGGAQYHLKRPTESGKMPSIHGCAVDGEGSAADRAPARAADAPWR